MGSMSDEDHVDLGDAEDLEEEEEVEEAGFVDVFNGA